jgi:CubicO group peptidase (beta-lactamase class C family)
VIVLHRGRIVAEAYPGMAPRDRHVWMSVAKTWGGLLAGRLQDAGRLDPTVDVTDILPEFARTAWRGVSLRDVLDMSTGLDLEETPAAVNDPTTPISRFFRAEFGEPDSEGALPTHNAVIAGVGRLEPPGVAARYSSVVSNLLGLVIERLTDRRIAAHMQDIWAAMGAERAATLCLSPQGQAGLHGLFSSTLRDLARFGLLHTPSWRVTSDLQVVSQAQLDRLWSTGRPDGYMKADLGPRIAQAFGEQPHHNAYQWDAVFADGDMFKGGMNGQGLYVSPRRDVVVAWFGINRDGIPMHPIARRLAQTFAS